MIGNRLKKLEEKIKTDYSNYHLIAFECLYSPEKNTYRIWDGVPGSGEKRVTKEEWEALAEKIKSSVKVKIIRGSPIDRVVKIIDDTLEGDLEEWAK